MTTTTAPGWAPGLTGRRPRRSEAEIRQRMLKTATGLVGEAGLTVSLEHLSYEVVIQQADVARSAVYRVWPTKEAFFEDLLYELAGSWQGTGAFDSKTLELALSTVADRADSLASPSNRREALLEAARLGAKRNFEALAELPQWRTYVAITATVTSLPDGEFRSRLIAKLQESEARFLDTMADFYAKMAAVLGYKLRPGFNEDFRLLAAIGAAVVEGLSLRQMIAPEIASRTLWIGPFSASEESDWTIAAFGFTAIVDAMIEEDPNFDTKRIPGILADLCDDVSRLSKIQGGE